MGPASPVTNEQLFWGLRAFAAAPTRLYWPSAALLDELDDSTPMFDRSRSDRHVDPGAAVAAGLIHRSLAETARDLQAWWESHPAERRAAARRWPTPAQEAAVLARLKA